MLFSSIPFLYYFLPIVLIVYLAVPKKAKNAVLLLSSLIFYAWGEPKYVLLMAAAILIGYFCALFISRSASIIGKRVWLIISLVLTLGLLGYFKYADFFVESFNELTGMGIPALRIALPIGISFYTFQIISYLIDVYRGDTPVQKNIISFAAYVSMFPQLIAGPIVRYSDIVKEIDSRAITLSGVSDGIRRFVLGLGKKIIIANVLGEVCDAFLASGERSLAFCWLYAVCFALHIYFDFSAYSDMAIGLGKIMGFSFPENFNYPFISRSITEFWRRWHMSLGSWFRDYVYIPLGGNRCGKGRHIFNIFVVWMLTGLWHGAAWNFVIWGVFFGIMLLIEKLWLLKSLEKAKVWGHFYVMILVMLSFVMFNAGGVKEGFEVIGGMFSIGGGIAGAEFGYYLRSYAITIIIAIIGATPLAKKAICAIRATDKGGKLMAIIEPVFLVCILLVSTAYLVDGSFNPFLYFRF
ncbi:MAG: MBOAT family protein [Oscillospiraceae bacterium]|nr:MBOAT family protein [Oscillospiraceae bacterium]